MKRSLGERIFDKFNIVFMLFICVIMLFPYLNQIALSLNEGMDSSFYTVGIFPRKFTLTNYKTIFQNESIMRATFITVSNVIASTLLSLFVTVGAAYALQKRDLPYRNAIILWFLIPMYVSAGIIPTYILYRYLGFLDNWLVYIIPGSFSFYNTIIIRSYMRTIPISLEESAQIEGANEIHILFRIILPLSMPVIATVALWLMVASWNEWTSTLMFITDRKLYTLQYVVMQIIKQSEVLQKLAAEQALTGGTGTQEATVTTQSVQAAAIIFSTIPIVAVYPFLQKYFVKGVMIGAVKD